MEWRLCLPFYPQIVAVKLALHSLPSYKQCGTFSHARYPAPLPAYE